MRLNCNAYEVHFLVLATIVLNISKNSWKTPQWFVSHYNFDPEAHRNLRPPKKVRVHDITLRDGEQRAGLVIHKDEKIQVTRALSEAGVARFEAGMPAVSKADAQAVEAMVHET